MPFGEGSAAMSFQVCCKSVGFFTIIKCNRVFDTPRTEFRCVRHIAFVMFFKAGFQIFGTADVEMISGCFVNDNINVMEVAHRIISNLPRPGSICFADYAAAVFPSGVARRSICCATGLPRRNLGGAEMKTGGVYKKELKNSLDPKIGKVFQEWCLMQFDEIISKILCHAENFGRSLVTLQSVPLKFSIFDYD